MEEHAGQRMIHTYMKGLLSIEDRDRIGTETTQKLREAGLTKCIWDVREAELGYSLAEIHQSILRARDDFRERENDRVALIYQNNQLEFEHARIATYNRAIPNVDFFQAIEDGIRWLTDKS
jgi:hypothetical protein